MSDIDKATLTYTQHTVAFPRLQISDSSDSVYDQVSISLDAEGGGSHGEFQFKFYNFKGYGGLDLAAKLTLFGDGIVAFTDERVQRVIQAWFKMDDPDDLTPARLIEMLNANGAVPSEHHLRPSRPDFLDYEIAQVREQLADLERRRDALVASHT